MCPCTYIYVYVEVYICIYHYYHHKVAKTARSFLTLSSHPSLSFIAPSSSSKLHFVFTQSS